MKGLLVILLTLAFSAQADEAAMLANLRTTMADPVKLQAAVKAGEERITLCKYCHGQDGNSVKDTIPNLAEQNAVYLLNQFELFASGDRDNRTMNELAKLLNDQEKVNVALYYSTQKVKPQTPYQPELVQSGKQTFETKCFFCHGKDGHGKEKYPRVAGQPAEFLKRTLGSYTSVLVKRAETEMSRVARQLSKQEIEALAAYLVTLK